MRIHGTILGQVDTYLFHIENLVQDEDQLADYAGRRGKTVEEMRKFLAANLQ